MKRRKPWCSELRVIVIAFVTFVSVLVMLWVESRTKLWYRLFWTGVQDIGLAFELDSPQYGQFTLTNTTGETVHDTIVTIREDFSYADEGYATQTVHVGDMEPSAKQILSYRYHSSDQNFDIGRLDLWIRSDRGNAYESVRWSYAGW